MSENNGRNEKGHWNKGVSGNPSGRPKGITAIVKEMSNDYEDYLRILHAWATDTEKSEEFRRKCIYDLMNRSAGMPSQSQKVEIDMPAPINFVLPGCSNKDTKE